MIMSAVLNFDIRNQVRATYANITQHQGCAIRHVFLLARTDYVEAQEWVRQEARRYGDVVQFDFDDSYQNLARKTAGGFYWVNKTCNNAKYIIKTDDDILVLPQNAIRLLAGLSADQERILYSGRLQTSVSARPVRKYGKWKVAKDVYPYMRYPPYVWGMGIIMSQEILQKFLRASNRVPQIHIEDAFVGLLARATGIKPLCNSAIRYGFKLNNHSAYHDYCRYQNLMLLATSHKDSARLWEGYRRAEARKKTCSTSRTNYFYTSTDVCKWPWVAKSDVLSMSPVDDAFLLQTCQSFNTRNANMNFTKIAVNVVNHLKRFDSDNLTLTVAL
jgi:hypothetical protein